jgi:hypothetical protein
VVRLRVASLGVINLGAISLGVASLGVISLGVHGSPLCPLWRVRAIKTHAQQTLRRWL